MISFDAWIESVKKFGLYWGEKKVRITCVDGKTYEGTCDGYFEDEDSNENAVWAVAIEARKFIQEMVEKIEFID